MKFAEKLQPYDVVITFNYDTLLERALEAAGVPYRLFRDRFQSAGRFGAVIENKEEETEIVLLKMHGSIDWFDRAPFLRRLQDARDDGYQSYVPSDPVFNSSVPYTLSPLAQGPRFPDDPLQEVHRLTEIERFYDNPPWFLSTPMLINPSAMKLVYSRPFGQFWDGMNSLGAANRRLVIVAYSLPDHDQYALQTIYRIVTNYQDVPPERVLPAGCGKEPLIFVDSQKRQEDADRLRRRYRFIDWDKTEQFFDGLNEEVVARL